jgi:integrase
LLAREARAALPYVGLRQFAIEPGSRDDYPPWHGEVIERGEGHGVRKRAEKFRLGALGDDVTAHVYEGHAVRARHLGQLGARQLVKLSADDVDRWLADKATVLSTRTLYEVRSVLKRSITRAQARDKVKRNVVLLCEVPQGRTGRPSKSLTLGQADALLSAAADTPLHAYIVVSLLTGARTEELRPLTWPHVDLDGDPTNDVPPSIMVWRSVRAGGDTKTRKSRRTIALPARCVAVLREQFVQVAALKAAAGPGWQENGLVFPSRLGTVADAANVRRSFRKITAAAGLDPADWTPRELRHSFVSLLSDAGVPIEDIARLVGHSGTSVTESVYRKQIRPVIVQGAEVMDRLFPGAASPATGDGSADA